MKLRFTRWNPRTLALPGAVLLLTAPHPVAHAQQETNPPPTEATATHPAQPSAPGLSVSPMTGGGWAVLSDVTGQLSELNPAPSWNALVQAAKAAEEGDADLTTASDQYVTIVRLFEELRPIAAEALYRYAMVERKRDHTTESQSAHFRLIQWFPDFSDYVRKSLAARNEEATPSQPGKTPPPSGDHPSFFKMSPALAARYGLGPSAGSPPNAPTPGGMDAEMARRYGLGGGPSTDSNPSSSTPMSPELMRRYGLLESPSALPESNPVSPAESAATGAKRLLLDQQRTEILTELSRTQSDLDKAQRELNRFESMRPDHIPPNLVSDPRLRQLIENATEPTEPKLNEQQALARFNSLDVYFQRVYIPRLRRTQEILMKESDILRARLNNLLRETEELSKEP